MQNTILSDETYFFYYSASIRLSGKIIDFDLISETLGLKASHTHKKGEINPFNQPYDSDMWMYNVPVSKKEPLNVHLTTLWSYLKPHKDFLIELKKTLKVDIYCGYRSSSTTAGFGLSPAALEIIIQLQVGLEVSVFLI